MVPRVSRWDDTGRDDSTRHDTTFYLYHAGGNVSVMNLHNISWICTYIWNVCLYFIKILDNYVVYKYINVKTLIGNCCLANCFQSSTHTHAHIQIPAHLYSVLMCYKTGCDGEHALPCLTALTEMKTDVRLYTLGKLGKFSLTLTGFIQNLDFTTTLYSLSHSRLIHYSANQLTLNLSEFVPWMNEIPLHLTWHANLSRIPIWNPSLV